MIKILPDVTLPWRRKIERRHLPPQARGDLGYREYRSCLRWEFGFSCAFCQSHETDLMLSTTEGWAVMQVEHFVPRAHEPSKVNDYTNCFYICRLCNNARRDAANRDAAGRELLNPCDAVWHDRFEIRDDEVRPRNEADGDAALTWELYDFGDRRKVRLRQVRRESVTERLGYLKETQGLEDSLLDEAIAGAGGPAFVQHVDLAQAIGKARRLAFKDLLRYAAVPSEPEPPLPCPCEQNHAPALPKVLEEQTIDVSELRVSSGSERRAH